MADNKAAWGIEIGQAGLKAIRLEKSRDKNLLVATNFDYIAHPKILNQPDAIPDELIRDAMKTFLSRNSVEGDHVAIALPGSNALSRFIKLPPVESSRIAEIVKYEARQQIPFPLEDVIWDYQPVGAGLSEGSFTLEAEIGLFAMKRDQVMKNLRPFLENKVEVELVQIAPLALFNFLYFDALQLNNDDDATSSNEHQLIMDMGTDSTTLIVSNGYKIWTRNIPMGGNHFTRALTKEMKLTFAKAEHLKLNATRSPDPRAVFQAMKSVFTEFAGEVQKSINFFAGSNREAKITKIIGVGGGFNMSGLQKYLEQHLQQYPVQRVDQFDRLVGDSVVNAPLFKENISTFVVPYGLALQQINRSNIRINLLPPEIANERLVRQKKPWAVVSAAALLAGLSLSAVGYASTYSTVSEARFDPQLQQAQTYSSTVGTYRSEYETKVAEYQALRDEALSYVKGVKDDTWIEFYKVLTECLPRDTGAMLDETDISKKNRVFIDAISTEFKPNVTEWYEQLLDGMKIYLLPDEKTAPPSGAGYVVTIQGVHYHHEPEDPEFQGANYLENTVLKHLREWTIEGSNGVDLPVRKMGIGYATLTSTTTVPVAIMKKDAQKRAPRTNIFTGGPTSGGMDQGAGMDDPRMMRGGFGGLQGGFGGQDMGSGGFMSDEFGSGMEGIADFDPNQFDPESQIKLNATKFTLQFIWKNIPKDQRTETPGEAPPADAIIE